MHTALCQRLGIELPIIQAPMGGGAAGPALAAAVSNAGGLGMLVPWRLDLATMRQQIQQTRALTSKPFGVNLNLEFPQGERLEAALEDGVRIISFFWRDPAALMPRAKAAGATVLYTVASAAAARRAVDCGVDIIVAQGWEAGGHVRGNVATMPLIPAVVDAVAPVPVVAAGGIADGRGLAGRHSVQGALGSAPASSPAGRRLIPSTLSHELILNASVTNTFFVEDLFDIGWPNAPHRVLRNKTVEAWGGTRVVRPPGQRPSEGEVIATSPSAGPIVRYRCASPGPDTEGDIDAMPQWAGQSVGLVSKLQSAGDIVREIAAEAEAILRRLAQ